MKLYFYEKEKIYLTNSKEEICYYCDQYIEEVFIYLDIFNKKNTEKNIICRNCSTKHKNRGLLEAYHLVFIYDVIPAAAIPIFKFKPQLVETKLQTTVFQEAERKNCRIKDNTKYSNRSEHLFLDVEKQHKLVNDRIKELDSPASIQDLKNIVNRKHYNDKDKSIKKIS